MSFQQVVDGIKSIIINNNKYKIGDKVNFKKPIIHPFNNMEISYGIITVIDSYFNPEKVTIYLADAMDYGDNRCTSYSKEYKLKELENLISIFK